MTRLWLIRHGEAHVNIATPDNTYALVDRAGLTERGTRQAGLLRDRLVRENITPDVIITSSLPRALQTASIVCEGLGVEPVIDDEVQEWRPGDDLRPLPIAEGVANWQRILAGHDHDIRLTPGSESHNEFLARANRALIRIADERAENTVLVFTHGGVIAQSFVTFLGLAPRSSLVGLRTTHSSITEWRQDTDLALGLDQPTWVLRRYNDATHLGEG